MSALNSARNAMKHGFCSSHFLARENAEQVCKIRESLMADLKPVGPQEQRMVAELALARFKVFENERLRHQRQVEENSRASILYEKQLLAEFEAREAAWRAAPAEGLPLLAANRLGLEFLMREWLDLRELVAAGQTMTFHQACEAALRAGARWRVQEVNAQVRRLFGLFLAIQPLPEQQIDQWVTCSRGLCPVTDSALAHEIYAQAPSADQGRAELLELIDEQIGILEIDQPRVQKWDLEAKVAFVETSCGLGLSDPVRTNEARLFQRYYTTDLNRADKLERILYSRQKDRERLRMLGKTKIDLAEVSIAPDLLAEAVARGEKARQVMEAFEAVPGESNETMQRLFAAKNAAVFQKLMEQPLETPPAGVESVPLSIHQPSKEPAPVAENKAPAGLLSGVDWSDPAQVTDENYATVERIARMPRGEMRQRMMQTYFGSAARFIEVLRELNRQTA